MLFYSGITRSADAILKEQTANVAEKLAQLGLLRDLAEGAADALRSGDTEQVGVALNKSWEAKRSLASGVSNTMLDAAVDAAVDAGATGAKVAGAGGGGFVAQGWCSTSIETSGADPANADRAVVDPSTQQRPVGRLPLMLTSYLGRCRPDLKGGSSDVRLRP